MPTIKTLKRSLKTMIVLKGMKVLSSHTKKTQKLMQMDSFSIIEMMMNKKSLLMLIEEWDYKMLMGLKI